MKKILVVDDQQLLCVAVAEKIERDAEKIGVSDISAVPIFTLAEFEVQLASEAPPLLTLLDLNLEESQGLETLEKYKEVLRKASMEVPVAIFSGVDFMSREGISVLRTALKYYDVKGVLPKSSTAEKMLVGIGRIINGETWIPENLMRGLLTHKESEISDFKDLTQREWDVARRIAKGLQSKVIAAELNLADGHVRQITSQILYKLGVRNRTEAAIKIKEKENEKGGLVK